MSGVVLSLIVAMAKNGTIGKDGGMPWHLPTDLKRFRALTLGKPVIMGRKTYLSIGQPLKGRTNIVISRNPHFISQGILPCSSFNAAYHLAQAQARHDGVEEIFVIGGGEIFNIALPLIQKIYLTEILASIEGDVFFPPLEQFLKSVKRFSDKNCGKTKELEQSPKPSETKTDLDHTRWRIISSENIPAGEKDSHATRFTIHQRL